MPISSWRFATSAAVAFVLAVAALAPAPAAAHPHVWIKVKSKLIAEGGMLVGLQQTWVFDTSWLLNQLEEHDKDKDGRLSAAETGPLAEESRQTLETFRSFTVIRAGGALVRAVKPRDVKVEYHGDVLGLTFTTSFAKPVPLKGNLLLEVYDAGYFSSFSFEGEDAVVFAGSAPEGCTIRTGVDPSPQQMRDYRQMLKEIGPELTKPFTPKSVAISCGPAPGVAAAPKGGGEFVGQASGGSARPAQPARH